MPLLSVPMSLLYHVAPPLLPTVPLLPTATPGSNGSPHSNGFLSSSFHNMPINHFRLSEFTPFVACPSPWRPRPLKKRPNRRRWLSSVHLPEPRNAPQARTRIRTYRQSLLVVPRRPELPPQEHRRGRSLIFLKPPIILIGSYMLNQLSASMPSPT
jgi:hypothetical protein